MGNKLDDAIASLTATVEANTSAVDSAKTAISGLAQQLADAIAQASAAGATDAQLQAITDLQTKIAGDDAGLADAIAANTGSAPAPTP